MLHDVVPHLARIESADSSVRVPSSIELAISQLVKAGNFAADTGRDFWQFAVTIAELRRDGISENELRWLVCRGYIEHAKEIATSVNNQREFDRHASLRFGKRSSFVITTAGVAYNREILNGNSHVNDDIETAMKLIESSSPSTRSTDVDITGVNLNGAARPRWDRDRRELRLNRLVVKVFKYASPMQETILMAFEEEQWPPRIDDPLPMHPEVLPKRRLHDTIKSLNRHQKNCLIRFTGDGTGEGVRWELISASDERMNAPSHPR